MLEKYTLVSKVKAEYLLKKRSLCGLRADNPLSFKMM